MDKPNLNIDTDEWHGQGNANNAVAPVYRSQGTPDHEFHDSFEASYGLAASAMKARLVRYSDERQARWEGIGDFHDDLGHKSHRGANELEQTDAAGGAATRGDDTAV
ncbi:hypothetical protein [Nocardia vaccinii]|uniref:hypothetical protein n=1 Tax=Nocardia vaccinii TaxID=1822 RepID=UPI00082E2C05|nr:hypothetical protein [Nocardia vaccinii]